MQNVRLVNILKKVLKKTVAISMVAITSFSLTACWDKVELERRGFVLSLGIDESEKNYKVTMTTIDTSGSQDKENATSVKSAEEGSVSAAMRIVDSYSSNELYYGHTKAVVFGSDILENQNLFKEAVDALERNRELNRKIKILATDGDSQEIMKTEAESESMYIANFYKNSSKSISVTVEQDLERLIKNLRVNKSAIIPKISVVKDGDNKELRIDGACVIKDFRLAGWLDSEKTKGCLWILGEGKGAQVSAEIESENDILDVNMNINRIKTNIYFNEWDENLVCNIVVEISGSIDEFTLFNNSLSDSDTMDALKQSYETIIADEIYAVIDCLQNEYEVDALLLGEHLRKYYWNLYKKYVIDGNIQNWNDYFSEIKIIPDVYVNITNTGAIK